MSTSHNIVATDSSHGSRGAPNKPGVAPKMLEGTKPFSDVLDAVIVTPSFDGTPNTQPVTTQSTLPPTSSKMAEAKPVQTAAVQKPTQKVETLIQEIKPSAPIVPEAPAQISVAEVHAAPIMPTQAQEVSFVVDVKDVEAPSFEPEIGEVAAQVEKLAAPTHESKEPVDPTTMMATGFIAPVHVPVLEPQQAVQTLHDRSKQEGIPTSEHSSLAVGPSLQAVSHNTVVQPENSPTALPQDLVNLIRGNKGEQPVATVEVQYPENNIPRIQLPLSVMNHVMPPQPAPQQVSVGLVPVGSSFMSTDAHSQGGSLSSSKEDHNPLQGLSASKANSAQGGSKPQTTPQDKAMMQEMVDRIRNLLKEQRQDMKVIVQHPEYGQVTMNLRFTQQNKNVEATFMSNNERLLALLQSSNSDINQVFQEANIDCKQIHVRRV